MQVSLTNSSNIPLLKTHKEKVTKAATALGQRMSSAFKQECALNKSTTAIFDMVRLPGDKLDIKVTAITKQ